MLRPARGGLNPINRQSTETAASDAPGLRAVRGRAAEIVCALLLVLMAAQMLTVVARKSITADEIVMIPAGWDHLTSGNFQLVNEHPPLSKLLAALPLPLIRPKLKRSAETGADPLSPEEKWAREIGFWEENRAAFESISFRARVPLIALACALGLLIFIFARDLFGAHAAALAVALYSLEPTVLAHGRVVQTDVPAAFGYLLFCYALYAYARAPHTARAAALGLASGLAIVAKFSMLLVAPLLVGLFALQLLRAARPRRLTFVAHGLCVVAASLFVVNAAYFFTGRPLLGSDARWLAEAFPANAELVTRAARALCQVLPTDFVLGVLWQLQHNGNGHPASLLGMQSRTGWWYYFPVAFALKTTLPFLLVSLAALGWGARELLRGRDWRFLVVLLPLVVYTAFVMTSRINIGVRYLLPAYPFMFIAGGALLERLARCARYRRAGLAAVVAVLAWVGVEAARAYPDHMVYLNQLAGGAEHWQYLSDSNVEWGDDTRELAAYLRARGETQVRSAALGATYMLRYYGVENVNLFSPSGAPLPETRYVAIGASFLNGSTVPGGMIRGRTLDEAERVNFFDAYRRRVPEAVFGGSIYLYRERE